MSEKIDDLRNEAYGLFLKLKDKEFWEVLEDGSVFAVGVPNEYPSYVEVRTLEGNIPVINIYWNEHDLGMTNLLNRIHYHRSPFPIHSALTEQNLAQFAFDERDRLVGEGMERFDQYAKDNGIDISKWERFPNLISFETGLYPKELDDEEKLEIVVRCLRAGLEVIEKLKSESAEELGFRHNNFYFPIMTPLLSETPDGFEWLVTTFPEKEPEKVITYKYKNAELSEKVEALRKYYHKEAYFARLPVPVTMKGENGETLPPFYPMGLVVTLSDEEPNYPKNLFFGLKKDYNEDALQSLLDGLAESILEEGYKPEYIDCYDDRTVALLKDFGFKTGIRITDRRKTSDERYTNLPVRLYNDVLMDLEKFGPMPEGILTNSNPEATNIVRQLKNLSDEDFQRLKADEEIEIEGLGKIDYWKYVDAKKIYSLIASMPRKRIKYIDQGLFPEHYDDKSELRNFSRLLPPKIRDLSYVFSVSAEKGNYIHFQVDADISLQELMDYTANNFGVPFDGDITMNNKFFSNAFRYEMDPYEDEEEVPEDGNSEEKPEDDNIEDALLLARDLFFYGLHSYEPEEMVRCFANEITLQELDLQKNQKFKYLYFDGIIPKAIQFKVLRVVPESTGFFKVLKDKSSEVQLEYPPEW